MQGPGMVRRLLAMLLALAMFAASGAGAYAVAIDHRDAAVMRRDIVVRTTDGTAVELSGLSRQSARAAVRSRVVAPLMQPVAVRYGGEVLPSLDPIDASWAGIVAFDMERLLDDAFAAQEGTPLAERILQRVTGTVSPLELDAAEYCSVDQTKTREWVSEVSAHADRPARNATRLVEDGKLRITDAEAGVRTNRQAAANSVAEALLGTRRDVAWPAVSLEPTVTADSFEKTIVVDVSERRLYLYALDKVDRTYRVAVGTPGFPTPRGEFQIVLKRFRPTWSNPGSDWAKDMPPYIPPGPGNPLGTRALNLTAPGIRIHGTEKVNSIGTAASHGCIRMLRANIEELYELVDVGTAVFIVP